MNNMKKVYQKINFMSCLVFHYIFFVQNNALFMVKIFVTIHRLIMLLFCLFIKNYAK